MLLGAANRVARAQNVGVSPRYTASRSGRVRLPRLISHAISHPNWKSLRRSSMLQLRLVTSRMPSSVSAISSSSEPRPGVSETLSIRMIGGRLQPSARIAPVERRPSACAVSRDDR